METNNNVLMLDFSNAEEDSKKNRNKMWVKMLKSLCKYYFVVLLLMLFSIDSYSQLANSANWLFPDGNPEGTRYVGKRSAVQDLDSFQIKWSTASISGDVKPLIGNIIHNPKLFQGYPFAPSEIISVQGGKIVVVDATGKTRKSTDYIPFVKAVSCLIDTTTAYLNRNVQSPVLIGLETMEAQTDDSLAFCLIAGYNHLADTVQLIRRLAVDLREFRPNVFASMKPVFSRKQGGGHNIYATVNMSNPVATGRALPFFRGIVQYQLNDFRPNYPLPDALDEIDARVFLGPEVGFTQPSLSILEGAKIGLLLPSYPTPALSNVMIDSWWILNLPTYADKPYLMSLNLSGNKIEEDIYPTDLTSIVNGSRPQIRTYHLNLKDRAGNDSLFILVTEEYKGREGSTGKSKLHLFDAFGDPITSIFNPINPSFTGGDNHLWSVAVGNVDGDASNHWDEYYPNNPGQEIIVTQSTREFAVANNRIFILRYYSGDLMEKPTPPGAVLYPFDTIVSQRINGWVAAVNDIDGAADRKDEIFIVDGSTLRVLRLNDYRSFEFRTGRPFDTVYTKEFKNQTISNVAIADLEGDGLNDIIVTTYDSTYVIGTEIFNTLKIIEPVWYREYCLGDTVEIKWVNLIKSPDAINVRFQPFVDDVPLDTTFLIHIEVDNTVDTATYKFVAGKEYEGYTGYFRVESSANPSMTYDMSDFVKFYAPRAFPSHYDHIEFISGERVVLDGWSVCLDSITLQLSIDDSTWISIMTVPIDTSGNYVLDFDLPCFDIFNCSGLDSITFVQSRMLLYRNNYRDTSESLQFIFQPNKFPLVVDECEGSCPTRTFRWNKSQINFDCDNMIISVSANNGYTFSEIGFVSSLDEVFTWTAPMNSPDSLIFRFCCENSCLRVDTVVKELRARFINIVAPNPFRPPFEQVEVVYTVPLETNVTIRIYDQNNRIVADVIKNQLRKPGIPYCDTWNGERLDGSLAANGMYYLSLELSSGAREVFPVYIKK